MAKSPSWLETAVFYEIYPQTYFDTNGDGIGDLPGILRKLEYLQYLGVDAVWLNPCFLSPFRDAGYDVADFYQVAPRYGTNEDLRTLFAEAKKLGIRIFLDLVPGHTSIENQWFQQSCQVERNRYTDYFIWTSSVWTWQAPGLQIVAGYSPRDANYITNFFYHQPALNYGFAKPEFPWQQPVDAPGPQQVREELRSIMRFWLEMGASGFRVDMAGSLVKHDPERVEIKRLWQENRAFLEREFPDAAMVSEWSDPLVAIPAGFHMDFLLPFGSKAYQSLFRMGELRQESPASTSFFDRSGGGDIRLFLDEYMPLYNATREQGFIAIPSGNHDTTPRIANGRAPEDLELAFLFLLTMPGTPFLYYGDEIGMVSPEGLDSKEGGFGRTGARTPMQWDASPNAGFSTAPASDLYLPVDFRPQAPTVGSQRGDPGSMLERTRRLIQMRHAHPAFNASSAFEPVYAERCRFPFIFKRASAAETAVVAINPSGSPCEISLPAALFPRAPETIFGDASALSRNGDGWLFRLKPVSAAVFTVQG